MARGLARRGDSITVLTVDLGLENLQTPPGTDALQRGRWGWTGEQDSVEAIYLPSHTIYRSVTWNSGASDFCRARLPSFDIVHIYGFYDLLGPTVARWCRSLDVPYVFEPMGMYRPIVRNITGKRIYRQLFGKQMVSGARKVIATAEQEQRELMDEGVPANQIVIRRNGIETPEHLPERGTFRRQWRIAPDAKVILFLGRVVTKKSPGLLIEAFANWQSRALQMSSAPPAVLVLAGPPESNAYETQLKSLAKKFGVEDDVLFTGPLYDNAKWAAYLDADLFVLPSQNENFGNTAAEAVVCGTPVLVTDTCGIAPLVANRAGEVVPHDCHAVASALGRLLDTEELRARLRAGCVGAAADLQWDQPLDETQALLRGLNSRTSLSRFAPISRRQFSRIAAFVIADVGVAADAKHAEEKR
jgi:glycosyltransferase involved in cell wall biosynthesis